MINEIILNRTYDANDEGVVFETMGKTPLKVRVPNAILEQLKLPDWGDDNGISYGGEPVEVQILELRRHYNVPSDPVHQSTGHVKW